MPSASTPYSPSRTPRDISYTTIRAPSKPIPIPSRPTPSYQRVKAVVIVLPTRDTRSQSPPPRSSPPSHRTAPQPPPCLVSSSPSSSRRTSASSGTSISYSGDASLTRIRVPTGLATSASSSAARKSGPTSSPPRIPLPAPPRSSPVTFPTNNGAASSHRTSNYDNLARSTITPLGSSFRPNLIDINSARASANDVRSKPETPGQYWAGTRGHEGVAPTRTREAEEYYGHPSVRAYEMRKAAEQARWTRSRMMDRRTGSRSVDLGGIQRQGMANHAMGMTNGSNTNEGYGGRDWEGGNFGSNSFQRRW